MTDWHSLSVYKNKRPTQFPHPEGIQGYLPHRCSGISQTDVRFHGELVGDAQKNDTALLFRILTKSGSAEDALLIGNRRRRLYGMHVRNLDLNKWTTFIDDQMCSMLGAFSSQTVASVTGRWEWGNEIGGDVVKQEDVKRLLVGLEAEEKLPMHAEMLIPKKGMTVEDLLAMLSNQPMPVNRSIMYASGNDVQSMDATHSAFELLDAQGHGMVTSQHLKPMLQRVLLGQNLGQVNACSCLESTVDVSWMTMTY